MDWRRISEGSVEKGRRSVCMCIICIIDWIDCVERKVGGDR